MIRKPAVSGVFYPESPEELKAEVKRCLKKGPGEELEENKATGIISPHAGYKYSGIAEAYAHKALAESGYPENLLVLGPSHVGRSNSVWAGSDWATPLGKVEVNRDLARKIGEKDPFSLTPEPHFEEHCLEVQLPFIQYFAKEHNLKMPQIVPIVFSTPLDFNLVKKFGEVIYSTMSSEDFKIVVSSDFTHYGMNYNYIPFTGSNVKERINDLDKGAIEKIEDLDLKEFVEYVNHTGATICGAFPIAVSMYIAKKLGSKGANLLKYYTSGDVINSYSNSVSYAAMEF